MRNILISLACIAVLGGAKCGGDAGDKTASNDTPTGSAEIDACALVSRSEAADLLGEPVAQGREGVHHVDRQMGSSISQCYYDAESSSRTVSIQVVYQPKLDVPGNYDAMVAEARSEAEGTEEGSAERLSLEVIEGSEPVSGVGRVAWFTPEYGSQTTYTDHHIITTSAGRLGDADDPDQAKARDRARKLAALVIDRL